MWASAVFKTLVQTGRLMVEDARGQRHVFGDGEPPRAGIRIKSRALERRIFFTPKLAIGEGYMDGELEIIEGDLYDFLDLCMANLGNLPQSRFHRWAETLRDKVALWQTFNPIHKAAGKVRHHYDLNGQLFDLFLDADRQYSCAYFKSPNDSLEQAQAHKKRRLAAKLHLADGHRVLDIGSGWGGLAMTLAGLRDVTVVGVTLSEEQYQHSRRRIDNAGLAERVRIHLQDYRQVQGHFDRIVSVGMLEHVGPRHFLEYYRKIAQLLTDNGVAVIHAIGKFHTPAPLSPWMAKYIFPGAYTPPLAEQTKAIEKAGLWVTDVEILRVHYADTLKAWRRRFQQNIDTARALYDDRFCRMWDFYLAGCEAAFRRGELMVFQIQLAKAVDTLPLTRDYMADYDIQTQPA